MLPALAICSLLAGQAAAQTTAVMPAAKPAAKSLGSAAIERRISELHSRLAITPAQQQPFDAFAQVMRDNAAQMDAAFAQRGSQLAVMNAVQDLQSYAQISQIQSDNMQKLATAFQALYASFPAAQQKVADGVFRPAQARH